MPPVKTVASSTDVDNDATAELPVLDVAAYEATLDESIANTDTWTVPAITPAEPAAVDGIPTLHAADLDLSGTHEMPSSLATPNKVIKATPVTPPASTQAPAMATAPVARAPSLPPPVTLPPSPPLIEEWRSALAAAERRIEELVERSRIADAERSAAVARANAENAQLRAQLGQHLESRQSVRGRLGVERADLPALEDELFARADRIAALERDLGRQAEALGQVRASLERSE